MCKDFHNTSWYCACNALRLSLCACMDYPFIIIPHQIVPVMPYRFHYARVCHTLYGLSTCYITPQSSPRRACYNQWCGSGEFFIASASNIFLLLLLPFISCLLLPALPLPASASASTSLVALVSSFSALDCVVIRFTCSKPDSWWKVVSD